MSDGNWDDVMSDYRHAQKEDWGKDFIWMEELISHLLLHRDLSKFYPITSHYVLSLFICNSYTEISGKPYVSIELSHEPREHIKDKFRYKISFINFKEDGEIVRQYIESVFCSFEKSLTVFDELIEKLKKISN